MVKVIDLNTAGEFMEFLRPSAAHWRMNGRHDADLTIPTGWIFRGKRDAAWTLLPKALRPGTMEPYAGELSPCQPDAPLARRRQYVARHALSEIVAVEWFLELADEVGIPTPIRYWLRGDIQQLKAQFEDALNCIGVNDESPYKMLLPPPHLVEAFAVAQHHGIPTRLLDWTRSPLIAAFFAARGAWRAGPATPRSDRIAVWALNIDLFGINRNDSRIQLVIAYGGQHDYLRSQGGLFLYDREANRRFLDSAAWPNLDAAIDASWTGPAEDMPFLKITVPVDQARDILRLLFFERITPAHLMPTLDNVAETVMYYRHLFETSPRQGGKTE